MRCHFQAIIPATLLALGLWAGSSSGQQSGAPAGESRPIATPQRIVSINLCTDQTLAELVPRTRIAAVSMLATDPSLSSEARTLRGLKQVKGTAEEVLALAPDLVLAGQYTTGPTVDLLKRLGVTVVVVPLATDFESMRRTIRTIGDVTGTRPRAEEVIAAFDEKLSEARSVVPGRPTAVAYEVNSLTSGPGTLVDAALDAAGYHNIARDARLGPGGRLPLEALVAAPPDLIVLANAPEDFRTVLADNLRHPAFAQLLEKRPHVHLPMSLWMCATPRIADAVAALAALKRTGVASTASAYAQTEPQAAPQGTP